MNKSIIRVASCLVALMLTVSASQRIDAKEQIFRVEYRDGSILICSLSPAKILWNEVADDGTVTKNRINIELIDNMRFSKSTVSQQVARIKVLINQLQDAEFAKRNDAENELRKIAGPFRQILENSQSTENVEARYRLKRLLKTLRREKGDAQASYDYLSLNDGRLVRGDSPGLQLLGDHYGREITLNRDDLLQISRVRQDSGAPKDTFVAGYRTYSKAIDSFYDSTMRVADFEFGENQTSLKSGTLLNDLYAFLGCRFECEGKENEVKVDSYDVNGRSARQCAVCFDYSYLNSARYKGVFRVQFCADGQPDVRATTNRVGCFLQMINPPRTIIVEAYNRDDECIGLCEAVDSTAFTGIESEHRISYIRVLTNKHLEMVNEAEPDNDFAVDDLAFEPTQRDLTSAFQKHYAVTLRKGDLIRCEAIEIKDGTLLITGATVGSGDLQVDLADVSSFVPPSEKRVERVVQHAAFARLDDGSVVAIKKVGSGAVADFPSLAVDKQNTLGIWGKKTLCRYAHVDDYKKGKEIIVFPALRKLVDEIELAEDSVSWDSSKAEIAKQTYEQFEDVTDPKYEDRFELSESPTVWFRAPQVRDAKTGMLRTTDRQRFVLGGKNGFRISELSVDSLTLHNGNDKISIPMTQVKSLVLPRK